MGLFLFCLLLAFLGLSRIVFAVVDGRRRPLDSRAYLFREGDPSDGVYCVLAGTIELGRTTADSASLIDLYGVGSWIGETSSLLRLPQCFFRGW